MLTLYNVVSKDGFIADKNGREDFIPETFWVNFLDLCKEYGSVVMGRKTYEAIQSYEQKLLVPFEQLPVKRIVITSDGNFETKKEYSVVHSPKEAMEFAPDSLVSSGPTLNNFLLRTGCVEKVILHIVPESIGEGIRPFDENLELTMIPVLDVPQVEGIEVKEFVK